MVPLLGHRVTVIYVLHRHCRVDAAADVLSVQFAKNLLSKFLKKDDCFVSDFLHRRRTSHSEEMKKIEIHVVPRV